VREEIVRDAARHVADLLGGRVSRNAGKVLRPLQATIAVPGGSLNSLPSPSATPRFTQPQQARML
jgi:hypothetical protein